LSFGGYRLALAALALVVFGAYDSYPPMLCSLQVYVFSKCVSAFVSQEM